MKSRNIIEPALNSVLRYFDKSKQSEYIIKNDHSLQYYNSDVQVILGFHSLALSVVDNKKDTAITFNPVRIDELEVAQGTVIHILRDAGEHYYNLFIGKDEIFQFSTIHDIEIQNLDIVTHYHQLILDALSNASIVHNTKYIQEAIKNLEKAHIQYSNE